MTDYLAYYLVNGVVIGSIYALIALGFNVIYSTTGVINFAQGEFVMIGGLTAASLHEVFAHVPTVADAHMALPLAVVCGVVAAGLVGAVVYTVGLRPAKEASPVTFIIITIALSIVLKSLASFVWGTEPYAMAKLAPGGLRVGAGIVDTHSLLVIPVAGACMAVLVMVFRATRAGLNMRACAENRDGARLCGISVERSSTAAFALSAALAGVGGVMITPILSMQFDGGMLIGLKGFSAAIVGGLGNPVGCVLGGLLVGVIEQFICYFSSGYKDILALLIVVIILLLRPRGLLGR